MDIDVRIERWPLRKPFRITGHVFTETPLVVVELCKEGCVGRGESIGVIYRGDTAESMHAQIVAVARGPHDDLERYALQELLPAGGARNALDCALWELEARLQRRPVWNLAGLTPPRPLLTTYTIGADAPDSMARQATAFTAARAIKLKLTGESEDAERVVAVREARPTAWLAVDANQGHTRESLERLLPTLIDARVELIEQPLPVGREADLEGLNSPIAIAADESAQQASDLPALVGRFDVVNIKLDKSGGLTHALEMARVARSLGLEVMVGNMTGTSWSQAPAFVLGQLCDVVDLDGPLFLAGDRSPGVIYEKGRIWCPEEVWGGAA